MNRRTLCIAIVGGLLSAGCASLAPQRTDFDHHRFGGPQSLEPKAPVACRLAGPCEIPVDVVTMTGNGVMRTVIVAPDAEIAKGNHGVDNRGVAIQWHLTNPEYSFHPDSIAFYEAHSTEQFSGPGVGARGDEFHYTDRNTDVHGYGYQIKVYNRRTGDWLTLDPYIWNNN